MSEDPNARPAEGYEGSGLGPADHGSGEGAPNPPDGQVSADDDLVHDGLGPRHDGDPDDAVRRAAHEGDLEHDALGPRHGESTNTPAEGVEGRGTETDLERDALGPHHGHTDTGADDASRNRPS